MHVPTVPTVSYATAVSTAVLSRQVVQVNAKEFAETVKRICPKLEVCLINKEATDTQAPCCVQVRYTRLVCLGEIGRAHV